MVKSHQTHAILVRRPGSCDQTADHGGEKWVFWVKQVASAVIDVVLKGA